tara:strand:+ start:1656 stop:2150 length:495 start_codon:yes stop_codon:yes gene_type:complete
MSYPEISKGLGKLTPEMWARLMDMLRTFESGDPQSANRERDKRYKEYFLAKITASAAIGGTSNRYTYSWTEVMLQTDTTFATWAGGSTGTTALNLCEMSNTADNVAPAVDLNGAAYPSGFTMRAIGSCFDSVQVDTVVVMFNIRDSGGGLRQVFALGNSHDGTC